MRHRIPLNDLGRAVARDRGALDAAIAAVLDSGWYVLGPQHDAFETELAALVGVEHAVGVGNGTDALQIALSAVGVGRNDVVATVANAGGYTSTAARALGATLCYVDVDRDDLLMTLHALQDAVAQSATPPRAVVVTHLFGAVADVAPIVAWCREREIAVVEDCAQSIGAERAGVRAGAFGDVATTSFYPTKNLGALGDGGAVLTSDPKLAARIRRLRQYGWSRKYTQAEPNGRNSRLDELQAAVLRVRLQGLLDGNARRRDILQRYAEAVGAGARIVSGRHGLTAAHLAALDCDDRDAARAILDEAGIATDVHYPVPDHRQPIAEHEPRALPVTERSSKRILSVPLFPELTDDEVEHVASTLARL